MKNLKKLVSSSVLAIGVLFASSFAANSAVITQTIVGDGTGSLSGFAGDWGTISVEMDNADLNTGVLLDTAFGDNITLLSFNLNELLGGAFPLTTILFEAVIDSDNVMAGVEAFEIDAVDSDPWSYQLTFDAFTGDGFLDIFNETNALVGFGGFTLGVATVTGLPVAVSAPATIAVFSLAMAGLYGRRKQLS
jgi:hypothetical protein